MNFETRTDFANHLREHQQATFWACTHCGHADESRELVENHLASVHTGFSGGNAIVEKSILRDLSKQRCPFCNETPGAVQFVGHLCHHLEEISLAAVPQEVEIDDDDEDDGHPNHSFISESREGESSQSDWVEPPHLRMLRTDNYAHHLEAPLLTNDTIDGTTIFDFRMPNMDSARIADLERQHLGSPPVNSSNYLVDKEATSAVKSCKRCNKYCARFNPLLSIYYSALANSIKAMTLSIALCAGARIT
jgi:hypothetical protein